MQFERPHPAGEPRRPRDAEPDPCETFALALRRRFGTPGRRAPSPDIGPSRDRSLLCPSAPAEVATLTIGRRAPLEPFTMVRDRPLAPDHSTPDELVRHASDCIAAQCGNWRGYCCLGAAVTITARRDGFKATINEPCAIAARCRWFQENGAGACAGCVFVRRQPEGVAADAG